MSVRIRVGRRTQIARIADFDQNATPADFDSPFLNRFFHQMHEASIDHHFFAPFAPFNFAPTRVRGRVFQFQNWLPKGDHQHRPPVANCEI